MMYTRLQSANSIDEVSYYCRHRLQHWCISHVTYIIILEYFLYFIRGMGLGGSDVESLTFSVCNRLYNIMIFSLINVWESVYYCYLSCWRLVSLFIYFLIICVCVCVCVSSRNLNFLSIKTILCLTLLSTFFFTFDNLTSWLHNLKNQILL